MVGSVDNHADATSLNVVQNIGMTLANLGSNIYVNTLILQEFSGATSCGYNVAQILEALSDFHSLRLIHIGNGNQNGAFVRHVDARSQASLVQSTAELVVAGHNLTGGFHLRP